MVIKPEPKESFEWSPDCETEFQKQLDTLPSLIKSIEYVNTLIRAYQAGFGWAKYYSEKPYVEHDRQSLQDQIDWMNFNKNKILQIIADLSKNVEPSALIAVDEFLIYEAHQIRSGANIHQLQQLILIYKSSVKAYNLGVRSEISDYNLHEKNLRIFVNQAKSKQFKKQ